MADKKISELTAVSAHAVSDILPVVQSSTTKRSTLQAIADWIIQTYASFTQPGSGAIAEAVQTALRRIVHTAQYSSTANYEAARAALSGTIGVANLDIDEGALTFNSNYVITRNAGAVQGTTIVGQHTFSASGHADGTGVARFMDAESSITGSNNMVEGSGIISHLSYSSSGTITSCGAFSGSPRMAGGGTMTQATAFNGAVHLISGAGNITTGMVFQAKAQTMTGSGTITNLIGFRCGNIGHAQVTNAYGVYIDDITDSPTIIVGIRSGITSGSGKWNLYLEGSANNAIVGNVKIGDTTTPGAALDVTGNIKASGQLLVANGSVSAPTISFSLDQNTGFYSPSTDSGRMYFASQGANTFRIVGDSNSIQIVNGSAVLSLQHNGTNSLVTTTAGQLAFASAALATNATTGFMCIPTCAGAPSGTPASIPTGQVPMIFDSTNNQIYIYDGGWLKTAALT